MDEKRLLKAKAEEMEIEVKKKIMEAEDKIKEETRVKIQEEFHLQN